MEFRAPVAIAETNGRYLNYLTVHLRDPDAGRIEFLKLIEDLGNTVESHPIWHPILTAPQYTGFNDVTSLSDLDIYKRTDHTVLFVRGFLTCPYSESDADELVAAVNLTPGLEAYRLHTPLYSDHAYPVVVIASNVELEADGTIRSRDALAWFTQSIVKDARKAEVAEDWWNMRSYILGNPHGSRSSLLVNQFTGSHMRKILETLNSSGMFGPVKEWSLEMLPEKKRKAISETLIRAAVKSRVSGENQFEFELRGEICKADISDTWDDGTEFSVRVSIGEMDLFVTGIYYPKGDVVQSIDPKGKRALAEKFL